MDLESFSEEQILSCCLMTNGMGEGEVERPSSDSVGPEDIGSAQFTPSFNFGLIPSTLPQVSSAKFSSRLPGASCTEPVSGN